MRSNRILLISLLASALFTNAAHTMAQGACKDGNNYFATLGGSSSDQAVKGSNGCKTLVMDDGFEIVTLKLGSIPAETTEFTMVNHDAEPGEGEVSVKYYYYSGNEVETLDFADDGKTATVCVDGDRVTVSWKDVRFRQLVNGDGLIKTSCMMTCPGR
ncbi:MAG: hypothetical protein IPL52_17600 [Flavobacteriales bacterium]|nr:hypothetical protein [Flavobacteriales bacterium]